MLLWLLYCLPLLLQFDRGVVHVMVVILPTITVEGLTEEWFMLFCYIVRHYYLTFDRGRFMLLLLLYCLPLLVKV
jgi:hypothetical protein